MGIHVGTEIKVILFDHDDTLVRTLEAGFNFIGVETGLVTADEFKAEGAKSIPDISHLIN